MKSQCLESCAMQIKLYYWMKLILFAWMKSTEPLISSSSEMQY